MPSRRSAYLQALEFDNSLPIEQEAVDLWLKDLDNPFRWTLRPILQLIFAVLLHLTWFIKRLPLPQFRAHIFLQKTICWFCRNFVSVEANLLILRHYATESNILNSVAVNTGNVNAELLALYPRDIDEMMDSSFVDHDQELFRLFKELGHWQPLEQSRSKADLSWQGWRPVSMEDFHVQPKRTQIMDFESAHALFMCLFCLLLTREEYRDAINGFNLDQSIAVRIGDIIGKPQLAELAYNKFPLYLVGPWNLGQRFLMHGFFTEYMYAQLEKLRV
jgi:hypothetical protein